MGWYGLNEKNRENFINKILDNFKCDVLDISDRRDHFWVLYKNKDIVSTICYLINKDDDEYMYKPISCESGPYVCDIPKAWLEKITSVEERLKISPNDNLEYFSEWIDEVKKYYEKEVELE